MAQFFDLFLLRLGRMRRALCSFLGLWCVLFLNACSNELLFSIDTLLDDLDSDIDWNLLFSILNFVWFLLNAAGSRLMASNLLRLSSKYTNLLWSIASWLFLLFRFKLFSELNLSLLCLFVCINALVLLSISLFFLWNAWTLSTADLLKMTWGRPKELSLGTSFEGSIQYSPCSVRNSPA